MPNVSAFDLAQRFVGTEEVPGSTANPAILAMLKLDNDWPDDDEVPWCSAFANYIAWLLRLPRSKNLRARSWLNVGHSVSLEEANRGFDVVILKRAGTGQPGPDNVTAKGHVGFYAGIEGSKVVVLSGNQSNAVNVGRYPKSRLLGIRRIA